MTFWIIVSIICILISILFYLSITQDTPNLVPNSDLEVYKDQLINVERDLSRGIITEDEAERIRAEISRRILELDKRKQRSLEKETKVTGLIFSIVFLLIFIAGVLFYIKNLALQVMKICLRAKELKMQMNFFQKEPLKNNC